MAKAAAGLSGHPSRGPQLPWAFHDPILRGFLVAACVTVLLTVVLSFPFGAPDPLQGRVAEMGLGLGRYVTQPRATVSVAGRLYLIQIDYSDRCAVGDQIRLWRVHRLSGGVVVADRYACVWPAQRGQPRLP